MKEIMNRAWEIYKTLEGDHSAKLSMALRMAWKESRKADFTGVAYIGEGFGVKRFSKWQKYGKNRIYINREDGKTTYGYIDLDNDSTLVCSESLKSTLAPYVNEFVENYKIA